MNIGQKIKKIRKQKEMTQIELADKIGMTQQNLSLIESCVQNTTLTKLEKFAYALDVPISIFFEK